MQDAGAIVGVISAMLLLGGIGCLIGWIIGMASIRSNGGKLARNSTFVAMALGAITVFSGLVLPRSHWAFGSAGGGDGFGILGLVMGGALVFAIALAAFLIAVVARAMLQRQALKEPEA